VRLAEQVAREKRCVQGFCGEIRGKETTWNIHGRWEDHIKMDLQDWDFGGWTESIWIRIALVNVVMNLLVP
jgi:hypothetical protein